MCKTIPLIISNDYELFGDGTGDIRRNVIEPTARMLDVCNRHGAKLTIFLEMAEFVAIRDAELAGKLEHLAYSPTTAICHQVHEAIRAGHDVQLHIHPQWVSAELIDGHWHLRPDHWHLSHLAQTREELQGLIKYFVEELEKLVWPIQSSYCPIAFRAGGLNIQPEQEVLPALRSLGIRVDSSVYQGGAREDFRCYHQYQKTPSNGGAWWVEDDVCQAAKHPTGFVEMPILASMQPGYKRLNWGRIQSFFRRYYDARADQSSKRGSSEGIVDHLKPLFARQPLLWDYCLLSAGFLERMLMEGLELARKSEDLVYPLTMIGHSKEFRNPEPLDNFLTHVRENHLGDGIEFATITEAYTAFVGSTIGKRP